MFSRGFDEEEDIIFSDSEFSDSEEDLNVTDEEEFRGGDEPVDSDNDMDIFNNSTNNDRNYKPVWTPHAPQFGIEKLNFTGTPGISNVVFAESSLDIFELIFTNEICQYISDLTNKYAENVMGKKMCT